MMGLAALLLVVAASGGAPRAQLGGAVQDPVAAGEAERAAAARTLFRQGVALADARRFAEAAERFERAYGIRPAPEIAYNHASTLERMGRLVRASEEFRQIAWDKRNPIDLRNAARERLDAVLRRVAHLQIKLDGPANGFVVLLDGRMLEPAMLGLLLVVDPGTHRIEARRGMSEYVSRFTTLKEGASRSVVLEVHHANTKAGARPAVAVH